MARISCGMGFEQPVHAVEVVRRLLAARQRQRHAALRLVLLLAPAHEQVGEDRGHRLVVARAARVEEAVFLDQRERVAHPVLAAGLDDVDVGQQHDRLELRILARERGDQGAAPWKFRGREDLHGRGRHARPLQSRCHLLRRVRATAGGQRRVGLDEFLVQRRGRRPRRGLAPRWQPPVHCRDGATADHGQDHRRPRQAHRSLQGLVHFFTVGTGVRGCRMDESRSGVCSIRSRCG